MEQLLQNGQAKAGGGGGAANSWLLGECEDVREKGWSES